MATNVTISGGASNPTVSIPFTTAQTAQAAQAAIQQINTFLLGGFVTPFIPTAAGTQTLPPAGLVGAIENTANLATNYGILPTTYSTFINTSSQVAAFIGTAPDTVIAGPGAQTVFINANTSGVTNIFQGQGRSFFQNAFAGFSSMQVTVDGGTVLGAGAAFIDASVGSATINALANSLVNVKQGGTVIVNAGTGEVALAVSGSGTGPVVTVTGAAAGSQLDYIPSGGSGFINPGFGNVVILAGVGVETLLAGPGVATVFGGTGVFSGGAAGGNDMQSGTIAGSTTLFGGGNNDKLHFNASGVSVGTGNGTGVFVFGAAGVGSETISSGSGTGTLFGGATGNNTFNLGGGTYTVFGFHNTGTALTANTYGETSSVNGGTITIGDFIAKGVGLSVFDKYNLNGKTAVLSTVGANTLATLSDGTKVTFLNAAVTNQGTFLA